MGYLEVLKMMGLTTDMLSENEYEDAVRYAVRKAKLAGRNDDYIPLLVTDVIKERLISRTIMDMAMATIH